MSDEQSRAEFEIAMGVLWPGTSLSRRGEDGYADVLTDRCWALHKHSWQVVRQQRDKDVSELVTKAEGAVRYLEAMVLAEGNPGASSDQMIADEIKETLLKFTPKERTDV